jgi:hypothetical protein
MIKISIKTLLSFSLLALLLAHCGQIVEKSNIEDLPKRQGGFYYFLFDKSPEISIDYQKDKEGRLDGPTKITVGTDTTAVVGWRPEHLSILEYLVPDSMALERTQNEEFSLYKAHGSEDDLYFLVYRDTATQLLTNTREYILSGAKGFISTCTPEKECKPLDYKANLLEFSNGKVLVTYTLKELSTKSGKEFYRMGAVGHYKDWAIVVHYKIKEVNPNIFLEQAKTAFILNNLKIDGHYWIPDVLELEDISEIDLSEFTN